MLNCKLIYHDKSTVVIARGQAASLKCRIPVHRSGGEEYSGADGNIVLTGMQFHRCVTTKIVWTAPFYWRPLLCVVIPQYD